MTIGVMLINTGTPDAPTIEAIKPYLSEFLMDPYIMGAPYPIRKAIVSHIVSKRPEHTVENYRAFWTPAGSPFLKKYPQYKHRPDEAFVYTTWRKIKDFLRNLKNNQPPIR